VGPGAFRFTIDYFRLIIGQRCGAWSGWLVGDWVCFGFVFLGWEGGVFCVILFGVGG